MVGLLKGIRLDRRRLVTREICPKCEIEPRLIPEFQCGIADCPGRTVKITRSYQAWFARKKGTANG